MTRVSLSFIVVAILLALSSLIVERVILNDSIFFKFASYSILLGWILRIGYLVYVQKLTSLPYRFIEMITYGILALLNLLMIRTKFYMNKVNEEEVIIHFVLDVLNLIFMSLVSIKWIFTTI